MSQWRPRRAMVLAAGYGKRMRPLTDDTPKPLIPVLDRPMIDCTLDRLAEAGVESVVVNAHHLAGTVEAHLAGHKEPRVTVRREERLLDTGGGIANALDLLGDEPFYVVNGDTLWLEGGEPALEQLARRWDESRMDALLLLAATVSAHGYGGCGDFMLEADGAARRRQEWEVAPFAFTGVQILHPRLFQYAPEGPFSLNLLYDQAEASERLFGLRHDGLWFHIGSPEDLDSAEAELEDLGFRGEAETSRDKAKAG